MPTWTIKGESGKGLDGTVRTIQSLGIEAASVEFATLAEDVFSYTMKTNTAAGAGLDGVVRIPTVGQKVELFKDGVRKFSGHATMPEIDLDRITVRVVGPFWWMNQLPVSSEQAGDTDPDTGADGVRPTFAFAQGDLRESLRVLNYWAKQAGVPVLHIPPEDVGDYMKPLYHVPKTTISGRSWGDALAEMIGWCPDCVAWYDHSGTNLPALRVNRRASGGGMTPRTLTIGQNVLQCRIRPRMDLRVQRVEVHYMTRNATTGVPRWARQGNGPLVEGTLQMVPLSGPDQSDLTPPDERDTYAIKTLSSATTFVNTTESSLVGARKKYGNQVSVSVAGGAPITLWSSWGRDLLGFYGPVGRKVSAGTAPLVFTLPNGNKVDLAGRHFVITGPMPDWVAKVPGINLREGELSGTFLWSATRTEKPDGTFDPVRVPEWVTALGMTKLIRGYTEDIEYTYYSKPFNMSARLVSINYSSGSTLYRPWLWDYLKPPANLAENLRDAQNWVPWEGTIETQGDRIDSTLVMDDVSCDNVLWRTIRVADSATVCATMDAMLRRVRYDIVHNRVTYTLGAPARLDFGSFISRLRSQRIDRIFYL
jgi:hypothetical protein